MAAHGRMKLIVARVRTGLGLIAGAVLVLSSAGMTAPQYRIVRSGTWDADKGGVLAESADSVMGCGNVRTIPTRVGAFSGFCAAAGRVWI